MRLRPALLLLALGLAACTTFDDRELAGFRAKRVPPPIYSKLSHGDALDPADVIALKRRGVADALIIRQIDDHGVEEIVGRDDVARLRKAGVSAVVIDALLWASDDFARGYAGPAPGAPYDYYPGVDYYDPWPWYGGVGFGVSTGRSYRGHHHHHHR